MQRQRGRTENGKGGMNGIALLLLMLALTVVKSGCVGVAGSGSSGGNPPTVSNPSAGNISSTGATISWTTNVPADSQVDYGTTPSYGQSSALNPALVTSHSVVLSGLTPSTLYHCLVRSKDSAGRSATSGDFTFTTASGGSPPVISGVTATNISTTGATVSWITDKPADSQVDYGTSTSYGSSTPLDSNLVTTHSQGLSGLTPGTLYHYHVKSKDGAGNQAMSGDFTFTTLLDNTPPVISGVSASPMSTSASIFWTTDKPADSQVDYGTTASYGQSSALISTQVISHTVDLSGLTPTTLYHYSVKSKGSNGLLATSSDNTFTTTAQSGGIPPGLGWFQIPNTTLASVCPNPAQFPGIQGVEGCSAVIADWSGGVADTRRNRLIVWGGGHNGYYGNEVYALDLNTLQMLRLNNPSPPTTPSNCVDALADNTPNSRHTYGGISYIGIADVMYVYGGGPACAAGGSSFDTWSLDLASLRWTRKDPHSGTTPCNNPGPAAGCNWGWPGVVSDWDPNTGLVFLHDTNSGFYSYSFATNTWTQLSPIPPGIDFHDTGVVDPVHQRFYIFGNGEAWMIDIPRGAVQDIRSQLSPGCNGLYSNIYPGLAFDTQQQKIVEWSGGNSVVVFDPATNSCTTATYPGGPGPQQPNGTFGRFRYFPSLGVFALVNDWQQNAFTLRLTPR